MAVLSVKKSSMDEVICECGKDMTSFFNQHDGDHISCTCPDCGRDIDIEQIISVIHHKYVYRITDTVV